MNELQDMAERAIDYTNDILHRMPNYRNTAIAGLRRIRDKWAQQAPGDPAIAKLDAYLETLNALEGR